MLPKLRTIVATAVAALALMGAVAGIFSASHTGSVFAIGLRSAQGSPIERSLPEPPDWREAMARAMARRSQELDRLLDLPTGPMVADPAPDDAQPTTQAALAAGAADRMSDIDVVAAINRAVVVDEPPPMFLPDPAATEPTASESPAAEPVATAVAPAEPAPAEPAPAEPAAAGTTETTETITVAALPGAADEQAPAPGTPEAGAPDRTPVAQAPATAIAALAPETAGLPKAAPMPKAKPARPAKKPAAARAKPRPKKLAHVARARAVRAQPTRPAATTPPLRDPLSQLFRCPVTSAAGASNCR